jgi:macrodomain Ter protein organizer (MatP/YcbG family)
MNDILDKAASHFQKLKENNEVIINVPEWETTLIARRGSAVQKEKFFYHYGRGEHLTAHIWLLIKRCLREDGKRAFRSEQQSFKKLSEEIDPDVIIRIANEILAFDLEEEVSPKDAAKN